MSKLNIITGKWRTKNRGDIYADDYYVGSTKGTSGLLSNKDIDHAHLIADAGNTYQATNMLPSEMAERIKALEDALNTINGRLSHAPAPLVDLLNKHGDFAAKKAWKNAVYSSAIHAQLALGSKALWPNGIAPTFDASAHGHLLTQTEGS